MILHLLRKAGHHQPLIAERLLRVSPQGIESSVAAGPIRHVLIVPWSTLQKFTLRPGDLRENVVVDDSGFPYPLHDLPSGTVLDVNGLRVRLTVHCEPCGRLAGVVKGLGSIKHQRGYLGSFLNSGTIRVGDHVRVLDKEYETIPYDVRERIVWYLCQKSVPVEVSVLVREIGLSMAYCRAIPNLTRGLDVGHMILYKKQQTANSLSRAASQTLT